jgi:hypothetical protein
MVGRVHPEPPTVGQSVTCTVNFGDGTTVAGTLTGTPTAGTCTATHTYTTANTFAVTVQISDGQLSGSNSSSHRANPTGVIVVAIDIKPGSWPNSINLRSRGVIPVAILTTDSFEPQMWTGTRLGSLEQRQSDRPLRTSTEMATSTSFSISGRRKPASLPATLKPVCKEKLAADSLSRAVTR